MDSWQRFLKSEICLHCESKEDLRAFLSYCDSQNIGWYGGGVYVAATKNRTFNRYSRAPICFKMFLGCIWTVSEDEQKLPGVVVVPYRSDQ